MNRKKSESIDDWLETVLEDYHNNREQTLRELLDSTLMISKQYMDTSKPLSKVTKGIMESCIECHEKFLEKIREDL